MPLNAKPVAWVARLLARLDDFAPGGTVHSSVLREGRRVEIDAVLAAGVPQPSGT